MTIKENNYKKIKRKERGKNQNNMIMMQSKNNMTKEKARE